VGFGKVFSQQIYNYINEVYIILSIVNRWSIVKQRPWIN